MKNNRGMTLVELIVTLAIFSIIMGVTASLILSGSDVFARGAQTDTDKLVGDAVYAFVESRVKYATHLTVAPAQDSGGSEALYVQSGRLQYRSGVTEAYDVYGEEFYAGRSIALRFYKDETAASDDAYILEVLVTRRGNSEPSYTARAGVRLENMSLSGSTVTAQWTAADAAQMPSCALLYDNGALAAGSYADRTVNELSIRAEILGEQYELLRTLYNAGTGTEKQAVVSRIRRLFGSETLTTPCAGDYAAALCAQCDGGSWPLLPSSAIPELASLDAALASAAAGASVRVLFATNADGTVAAALYYAGQSENAARLIYSTRTDAWYAYTVKSAGGVCRTYAVSGLDSAQIDALLSQVERQQNWLKIS
ncbi:MAG: prepilin-type N-terminal cleavage/methylation domain-containing protein [Oscillospiraceae bacterium]|nr:prepilin-type N-terminal cleavage/methylation domain-containing protein [Oscillospiraceae bacterium]